MDRLFESTGKPSYNFEDMVRLKQAYCPGDLTLIARILACSFVVSSLL